MLVSLLTTVTDAPATAAPLGSFTVPEMLAVTPAKARPLNRNTIVSRATVTKGCQIRRSYRGDGWLLVPSAQSSGPHSPSLRAREKQTPVKLSTNHLPKLVAFIPPPIMGASPPQSGRFSS